MQNEVILGRVDLRSHFPALSVVEFLQFGAELLDFGDRILLEGEIRVDGGADGGRHVAQTAIYDSGMINVSSPCSHGTRTGQFLRFDCSKTTHGCR